MKRACFSRTQAKYMASECEGGLLMLGSAPPCSNTCMHSALSTASASGVLHPAERTSTLALCCSRHEAATAWPRDTAKCSGRQPTRSLACTRSGNVCGAFASAG